MLLAIDIGNTRISFGVFRKTRLISHFSLPTYLFKGSFYPQLKNIKKRLAKGVLHKITDVVICSVAPTKTTYIKRIIKKITSAKIVILGKEMQVPIKNLYKNPSKVGQDRLVNAYAAIRLYGPGLILIDFGTAVTFDVVSRRGEYIGGLIHPGLGLSLKSLHENTALLPNLKKDFPKSLIGRDTRNSILSGVVFGIAQMCDRLIKKIRKRYKRFRVVCTGGDGKYIKPYCRYIDKIDSLLTLKGIMFIYNSMKKA